jgi:hypothetical protein
MRIWFAKVGPADTVVMSAIVTASIVFLAIDMEFSLK